MTDYIHKYQYKCRLCGEIIDDTIFCSSKMEDTNKLFGLLYAIEFMSWERLKEQTNIFNSIRPESNGIHHCSKGTIGITDIVGVVSSIAK